MVHKLCIYLIQLIVIFNFERMSVCTIQHLTHSYANKQQIKYLDLRSTSTLKIHVIENLDMFTNLRTLILSNNMISQIAGLTNLRKLKILNLQFNQIKEVKGLEKLGNLEELFLSYNEIQRLTGSLRFNQNLKVLFLAYNQIANLEDIAVLYSNSAGPQVNEKERDDQKKEIRIQEGYIIEDNTKKFSPIRASKQNSFTSPQLSPYKTKINDSSIRFPYLTHISLANNPIIDTLNYTRFLSMLIPTLTTIDDAVIGIEGSSREQSPPLHTNQSKAYSSYPLVQPNQQILILREAIDGLLDERDEYLRRLQEQNGKMKEIKEKRSVNNSSNSKTYHAIIDQHVNRILLQQKQWEQILLAMSRKYKQRLDTDRHQISQVSEVYTGIIISKKNKEFSIIDASSISPKKILSQGENSNNNELQVEFQAGESRNLLKELKELQQRSDMNKNKLKRVNYLLTKVQEAIKSTEEILTLHTESQNKLENPMELIDASKMILEFMVFGSTFNDHDFQNRSQRNKSKVMSKYYHIFKKNLIELEALSNPYPQAKNPFCNTNLVEHIQFLNNLIFGNESLGVTDRYHGTIQTGYRSALVLKDRIGQKSLLEIISELHESAQASKNDQAYFAKNRKKFIKQFECQTQRLYHEYQAIDKLKQDFEEYQKNSLAQLESNHRKEKDKYVRVEKQEKQKIKKLKQRKEELDQQCENKQKNLNALQQQLQAKILQLQEFQKHFDQFIREKEKVEGLSQQLLRIEIEVKQQEDKFDRLTQHIQTLKIQQNILINKCSKLQSDHQSLMKSIKELEQRQYSMQTEYSQSMNRKKLEFHELNIKVQEHCTKLLENKQLQKNSERLNKNYFILQDKISNLDKIYEVKKHEIREIQQELSTMALEKNDLLSELERIDNTILRQKQEQVRYEMKLRENRLAMESLADLNSSINQMRVRQSQLKRANIELEIQNRNLLDMRNGVMEDLRLKNYL